MALKKAVPRAAHRNGRSKKKTTKSSERQHEVITLRIGFDDKAKLLAHCGKRAEKEGRQVSFNRAIIDMIGAL